MSGNLRLYNSGGYVELQAPSNATSQTLVLPTDSIQPGLVHLHTESFISQLAVSIDNVFTSDYESYRITYRLDPELDRAQFMRLRANGSDITTGDYNWSRTATTYAGAAQLAGSASVDYWALTTTSTSTRFSFGVADIIAPNLPAHTGFLNLSAWDNSSGLYTGAYYANTQADGFTVYGNSGSITGSLSIYGYRNS